MSSLGLRMR